jgi:hypothetical protein
LKFSFVVNDLVEEEIKNGIPSERVVRKSNSKKKFENLLSFFLDSRWIFNVSFRITNFSSYSNSSFRGGAVAIHTGIEFIFFYSLYLISLALTSPHTLGGVLALSSWLPLSTTFPKVSLIINLLKANKTLFYYD